MGHGRIKRDIFLNWYSQQPSLFLTPLGNQKVVVIGAIKSGDFIEKLTVFTKNASNFRRAITATL